MDSTKRKRPTTPLSATLPVKRSVKKIKRNKPAEKPHYRYTKAQIAELEAYYKKNKYPSLDERSSKFGKWGIIGSKIESWFVRRRERARKNNELPARAVPIFPISEKGELELEILYQRMPFPSPTDQQELADRFGVKVKQIITWFASRRMAERAERRLVPLTLDYGIIRQTLDDDSKEESIARVLRVWLNCNPEDYAKNFERYAQHARRVMSAASDSSWAKEIEQEDSSKILTAFARRFWAAPKDLATAARADALKQEMNDFQKQMRDLESRIASHSKSIAFLCVN